MDSIQKNLVEEKIVLNGKEITQEEFLLKKKQIEEEKNIQLVEVKNKIYKTRLFD